MAWHIHFDLEIFRKQPSLADIITCTAKCICLPSFLSSFSLRKRYMQGRSKLVSCSIISRTVNVQPWTLFLRKTWSSMKFEAFLNTMSSICLASLSIQPKTMVLEIASPSIGVEVGRFDRTCIHQHRYEKANTFSWMDRLLAISQSMKNANKSKCFPWNDSALL